MTWNLQVIEFNRNRFHACLMTARNAQAMESTVSTLRFVGECEFLIDQKINKERKYRSERL